MGDKRSGPMPNYKDAEGERIRVLLESKSPEMRQSVKSALLEIGVDPFMADFYGRNGDGRQEEIEKYLSDTKQSRRERRDARRPRGSAVQGAPSPWTGLEKRSSGK